MGIVQDKTHLKCGIKFSFDLFFCPPLGISSEDMINHVISDITKVVYWQVQ